MIPHVCCEFPSSEGCWGGFLRKQVLYIFGRIYVLLQNRLHFAMDLDLNCDLGEGEPLSHTKSLMRSITSANVACGGHAGNFKTLETCVCLANEFGVNLGAHPGLWDRASFGRAAPNITPHELELLLLHQVGAIEKVAHTNGCGLHHIKLHGALYHACDSNEKLGWRYLSAVARWWPGVRVYARAGGRVARLGRKAGVPVWEEVFLDRGYFKDGTLVPRIEAGAQSSDLNEVRARLRSLAEDGHVIAVSGEPIRIKARTACIHADAPQAIERARAARKYLEKL